MAEQEITARRRVLHVAPPSRQSARRVVDALRRAGHEVVDCPDVYRAVARVCGSQPGEFLAIVVCADWLEADQFEFFQIVSRGQQRVPIYVYGGDHARAQIDSAIRLGAKAEISARSIESAAGALLGAAGVEAEPQPVLETDRDRPAPAQAPASVPDRQRSEEVRPEGPSETTVDVPSKAPREVPSRPVDADVQKSTRSVRVPWLRYEGGPKRTPPNTTARRRQTSPPPADEPEPPLLTPEELEALIGDKDGGSSGSDSGKRGRRK